jgi:hypothetical protein
MSPRARHGAPVSSPLTEAGLRAVDAAAWVMFALGKLEAMRSVLSRSKIESNAVDVALFASANTHFHIDYDLPNSDAEALARTRQRIAQLITTYRTIAGVIANSAQEFAEDLANTTAYAYAVPGGLSSGVAGQKRLHFCPPYLSLGPMFQTAVIVHEAAHYVDVAILHFASELPAPNGTPVGSPRNYAQLSFDEARRNAYSYAQFALHSFSNFDRRLRFPSD